MKPTVTRKETRRLFSHIRYSGNPGPKGSTRNTELRNAVRENLLFTIQEEHMHLPHVGNSVKIICLIEAVEEE